MTKDESSSYLHHLIPKPSTSYSTRNSESLPPIRANHSFFKDNFFFIYHHKMKICCFPSCKLFRNRILEFVRPQPDNIFNAPNSLGLTYLTRVRVGLSHLHELKFRHNFRDSLNPICNCGNATK